MHNNEENQSEDDKDIHFKDVFGAKGK